MTTQQPDPLAHASETPDVSALIQEFEQAQWGGLDRLSTITTAEDIRFNRWGGKSNPPDGCRWQKNAPQGTVVRPYDGRPDVEINLPDEICNAEVDMLMTAFEQSQIGASSTHVTPLTAAQAAEMRAVAEWVKRATASDRADDAELLAQMLTELGWSVLNTGWLERYELVERSLPFPELLQRVAQVAGPDTALALAQMIPDPTLEKQAVDAVRYFFAHVPVHTVRQMVRAWRDGPDHTAEFLDRALGEKRPTLRTLIQGYNYFITGATGRLRRSRGHLVVERFYQAELEALAADNDWNNEFVEEVIKTAGQYSAQASEQQAKDTQTQDGSDKSMEIWTTSVLQFDEDTGAAGIYCTTFSPHIRPGADGTKAEHYAKHYLLGYAHGRPPFVQFRREVIGPALDDSRGVPELLQGDQSTIKKLTDAAVARAHLETDPPLGLVGSGWSKSDKGLAPGARLEAMMPGADVKALVPNRGNPQYAELAIKRLEAGARRRFALPNTDDGSHPSQWQMRQMRNVKRWLNAWAEVFWQLVVLCYQEFNPQELAEIIGRPPQLTVDDVLKHRVTLTFDARALDQDWTATVLKFVIQLLGIDSAGLMDRGPIIQLALNYIDPTIVQGIMRSPEGASAALYRHVEQDISSIMDGNPPQLRENDASAGMQMQMTFAVIGKNPRYQQKLQQDQGIQENLKTYMENLQHNQQETEISPQQGRLGVAAMPQRPVMKGSSVDAMAMGGGE